MTLEIFNIPRYWALTIGWWVYANTVLHSKVLKNRRDNEYDAPMILKIMQGKIIIFERYLV